ncbi:MAG: hypothetical protein HY696_07740 [Deltaproteobacteria bacterium]|nr:hypothetical protein [Deltaproteobacteria bacterium]
MVTSRIPSAIASILPTDPSGFGCRPESDAPICLQDYEQQEIYSHLDLNGDGAREEIRSTPYRRLYDPSIWVHMRPSDGARVDYDTGRCFFELNDIARPDLRKIPWYRQPDDPGVHLGDWVDIDGNPWVLNSVTVNFGPKAELLTASGMTALKPRMPVERMVLVVTDGLGTYRRIPLETISALTLYPATIAAETEQLFACLDTGNDADCRAAADISPQARLLTDRLRTFESRYGAELAILAGYAECLRISQRIVTEGRDFNLPNLSLQMASLRDLFAIHDRTCERSADRDTVRLTASVLASFKAFFADISSDELREITREWLATRYGLAAEDRDAIWASL